MHSVKAAFYWRLLWPASTHLGPHAQLAACAQVALAAGVAEEDASAGPPSTAVPLTTDDVDSLLEQEMQAWSLLLSGRCAVGPECSQGWTVARQGPASPGRTAPVIV